MSTPHIRQPPASPQDPDVQGDDDQATLALIGSGMVVSLFLIVVLATALLFVPWLVGAATQIVAAAWEHGVHATDGMR